MRRRTMILLPFALAGAAGEGIRVVDLLTLLDEALG